MAIFGVECGSPANGAKPEYELRSLIFDGDELSGGTEDFERSREAGQRHEDTSGPRLAGEAMANANFMRFTFDLNAQLPAGAGGCSGMHRGPRRMIPGARDDCMSRALAGVGSVQLAGATLATGFRTYRTGGGAEPIGWRSRRKSRRVPPPMAVVAATTTVPRRSRSRSRAASTPLAANTAVFARSR